MERFSSGGEDCPPPKRGYSNLSSYARDVHTNVRPTGIPTLGTVTVTSACSAHALSRFVLK